MKKVFASSKRASLLLIFLFSVGAFAVILSGAYFIVTNAATEGSELTKEAKKQTLELAADTIFKSELERGSLDFVENGGVPTITYTAGNYQTLLTNALNWGVGDIGSLSGLTVTLPNTTTYPPFSKDNAVADDGEYLISPMGRFPGYRAEATVSATLTPDDSGRSFSYNRNYTFYKEIPLAYIPVYLAYPYNGDDELYEYKTTAAANYDLIEGYGYDAFSNILYGGGVTHVGGWTDPSVGLEVLGETPDYRYPNLYNSLGVDALEIAKYYVSSVDEVLNRQNYSLDANAIVVEFDGSSLSIVRAPVGGTTVPAAMTVASFQGLNRCVIDMSTLPTTGNYQYLKWYIYCSSNDAKAAGIVIDDDAVSPAAATVSIATDGHVYYKGRTVSDERTALVMASNYGALGLCDENYAGSGTSATALDVSPQGFASLYAKEEVIIHDSFNRAGSLASDTPDIVNLEGLSWGSVTGSLTCTTLAGGSVYAENTAGSYSSIAVPQACKETAGITISAGIGFSGSNTRSVRFYLAPSAINPTTDTENIMFRLDAGTTNNFTYAAHSGSTTDTDVATASVNAPSGTPATLEITYLPSIGRIIVKDITTPPGTLIMDKRMATFPNWSGSRIPNTINLFMVAGDSSTQAAIGNFKVTKQKYGTILHTPHTGSVPMVQIMGGLALGDQLGNLMGAAPVLMTWNGLIMGDAVAGFTERIIVNHPHYRQ